MTDCSDAGVSLQGPVFMHFQYLPYLWFLLASTVITVALGLYAWRHRTVLRATPFVALMSLATLWSFANGLEMAGADLPTKLFWANVQYLCYVTIPVVWLALALQINGRGEWLTRRRLALLMIIPMITVALVWSGSFHDLMRRNVRLDSGGPFSVIAKTWGPWFWVNIAYSYGLLLTTIFLLVKTIWRAPSLYRRQALIVLISLLLPLASSAAYNFGLSPIPRHDISPVVFALSGVIVAWGLFHYHLFDIMPVAWTEVVKGMEHGVIVLDDQDRVVDTNLAARTMLGQEKADGAIGLPAKQAFTGWPELAEQVANSVPVQTEMNNGPAGVDASFHHAFGLRISSLTDRHHRPLGRVIILNDITERKEAEARLAQQQRMVAVLEERERLARELHDSLGQVLGYVNVQAQAAGALLARGKTAQVNETLLRLEEATHSAQADVRAYIAGVRVIGDRDLRVGQAIANLLQEFQRINGIETELAVRGQAEALSLPPAVKDQLLFIVQEALSNVRKHAGAQAVRVVLSWRVNGVMITVEDNGHGFDPAGVTGDAGQHFGLEVMRERAESVKGRLQIESIPGQGTRITLQIPLIGDEREANEGKEVGDARAAGG